MESSRRDLLNDMAEHRPTLKNNQNTYHPPRFGFTSKTGIAFPETEFCCYCVLPWFNVFMKTCHEPALNRTVKRF